MIGPIPFGTGVIILHFLDASSNSTSPTIDFSSTPCIPRLTPASITMEPGLIQSALTIYLSPAAEIIKSEFRTYYSRFSLSKALNIVTLAFLLKNIVDKGYPTNKPFPMIQVLIPYKGTL